MVDKNPFPAPGVPAPLRRVPQLPPFWFELFVTQLLLVMRLSGTPDPPLGHS